MPSWLRVQYQGSKGMSALLKRNLSDKQIICIILFGTLLISLFTSLLRPSCSCSSDGAHGEQFRVSSSSAPISASVLHRSRVTNKDTAAYDAIARYQLAQFKARLMAAVLPAIESGDITKLWPSIKPIIYCPADRGLTKYGGHKQLGIFASNAPDDGQKLLCKLPAEMHQGPCTIYSLGSNGDYSFEQSMLAETVCDVHTFDCTYDGQSQDPKRHWYHKWCVGDPAKGEHFRTWSNITASLGHKQV